MNTNRNQKGKTVAQALAEKNAQIFEILEQIENALYDADNSKNWGHVGDTNHVLENLKEIQEFFCK